MRKTWREFEAAITNLIGNFRAKINETRVEGHGGERNDIKESFTRLASELLSKHFSAVSDDHFGTS